MRIYLAILLLLSVSVGQALSDKDEYDGLMPAVEVVASRCNFEGPAYVGSLPAVDVTAPRYEFEDDAWSGLMPETIVTAVRTAPVDIAYLGSAGFAR
ncbi:MAG: hypothetical protein OEV79_06600 [candidate division WOR-3 bacterium]|nr:hypothetical protein [candidate division WOR-3 bacterium]